jgi:transitional endoplasmic reticulum ATPase
MLIFDEAESFLFDRRDALRSWEVTQVNEMLTWMESHPLPVCCTTNLMDRLDIASLRRFTFHIRLGYLDKAGLVHAFKVFFGFDNPPAALLQTANLTPGDFAQVRRQGEVLGLLGDAARMGPSASSIRAFSTCQRRGNFRGNTPLEFTIPARINRHRPAHGRCAC